MKFISTRQQNTNVYTFREAVLRGMPEDGGLFIPALGELPKVSESTLNAWRALSYERLAFEVISLFCKDDIPPATLKRLLHETSKDFALPDWTRLTPIDSSLAILELYHGPTFSFKDYAMCILGRLLEYLLQSEDRTGTVLVATSGDTGSAAIGGFQHCSRASLVVLYPEGRVSEIQRRQMTTCTQPNIRCLSVRGNFDDCQRLLKEAFADDAFRQSEKLMAVNSVNFARIACQIVYYFWSAFQQQKRKTDTNLLTTFCVPTGNFGNILAAYYAKQMGCPIGHLIIASNVNNILPRFCDSGDYELREVTPTISPSIDIQVSSNFERLLQDKICLPVGDLFVSLNNTGKFHVNQEIVQAISKDFSAYCCDDKQTLAACKQFLLSHNVGIDTHTGVALCAYNQYRKENHRGDSVVIVSTAHPSKFADALKRVLDAEIVDSWMPAALASVQKMEERFETIDATLESLKAAFTRG